MSTPWIFVVVLENNTYFNPFIFINEAWLSCAGSAVVILQETNFMQRHQHPSMMHSVTCEPLHRTELLEINKQPTYFLEKQGSLDWDLLPIPILPSLKFIYFEQILQHKLHGA